MTPAVSICVPAFDAARFVGEAVDSALAQTAGDLEVVVVDDGSADGTAEVVAARGDARVRLLRHGRNRGQAEALNTAIRAARAPLVKPLAADDALEPRCVERLAAALDRHPSAGLAFAPRTVVAEIESEGSRAWRARYGAVHEAFGALPGLSRGGELLGRWLADGLRDNHVGEPTSVLLRRTALARSGLFDPHVRGPLDLDLWARLLAVSDLAFVDEPLSRYRLHGASLSARLHGRGRVSLDRAWTLHNLHALAPSARVAELRREAERRTAKDALRARRPPPGLAAYAAARLRRAPGFPRL